MKNHPLSTKENMGHCLSDIEHGLGEKWIIDHIIYVIEHGMGHFSSAIEHSIIGEHGSLFIHH